MVLEGYVIVDAQLVQLCWCSVLSEAR